MGRNRWEKLNLAVSPQPLPLQRLPTWREASGHWHYPPHCIIFPGKEKMKRTNAIKNSFIISLENIKLYRSSWQSAEQHCGWGRQRVVSWLLPRAHQARFLWDHESARQLRSLSLWATQKNNPVCLEISCNNVINFPHLSKNNQTHSFSLCKARDLQTKVYVKLWS